MSKKKKLFDEDGCFTELALSLHARMVESLHRIVGQHPKVNVRELQLLMYDAACSAGTEVLLDRRKR